MKVINIIGGIGGYFGVSPSDIRRQLRGAASDEDLQINISSYGGSVFDGFEIFNLLRMHAGKKVVNIVGKAMSMGSYIAMVGDEINVFDNSAMMIHDPWSLVIGNWQELEKESDILSRLSDTMALAYAKKSKKQKSEVRGIMAQELYYFGQEIINAGFADKMLDASETDIDVESAEDAELGFELFAQELREQEDFRKSEENALQRLVARHKENTAIKGFEASRPQNTNKQGVKDMTIEELKEKHAALYNEILGIGVKQERDRVNAHLKFAEKGIGLEYALGAVKNGKEFDQEAHSEYVLAATMKAKVDNAVADNPDPIVTDEPAEADKPAANGVITLADITQEEFEKGTYSK